MVEPHDDALIIDLERKCLRRAGHFERRENAIFDVKPPAWSLGPGPVLKISHNHTGVIDAVGKGSALSSWERDERELSLMQQIS
jgi:hypothetical protein